MKKKVLILGVGSAQLDAILRCKEHDHEVFALGYRKEGQGLPYADHFEVIDIADKLKVLEYARAHEVDLVFSIGSDIAMPTIGFVSERLGTPFFVSEDTAQLCHNKGLLREFLGAHNISPLDFSVAGSLQELAKWDNFPAVIKPVDSQGQRGVFKVRYPSNLPEIFLSSLSCSRSRRVIVERFIEGCEISVNAFVRNGSVVYSFISDRITVKGLPGGIAKAHIIPSNLDKVLLLKAKSLAQKAITAIGIQNGPVYAQMKCTPKGEIFIIELAPRLDGCHIWRLIKLKYGVDLLELSLQVLERGLEMPLEYFNYPESQRKGSLRLEFFLQEPNTPFRKTKLGEEGILYREWYYSEGQIVRPINEKVEKIGYQIKT